MFGSWSENVLYQHIASYIWQLYQKQVLPISYYLHVNLCIIPKQLCTATASNIFEQAIGGPGVLQTFGIKFSKTLTLEETFYYKTFNYKKCYSVLSIMTRISKINPYWIHHSFFTLWEKTFGLFVSVSGPSHFNPV